MSVAAEHLDPLGDGGHHYRPSLVAEIPDIERLGQDLTNSAWRIPCPWGQVGDELVAAAEKVGSKDWCVVEWKRQWGAQRHRTMTPENAGETIWQASSKLGRSATLSPVAPEVAATQSQTPSSLTRESFLSATTIAELFTAATILSCIGTRTGELA